jgi:hypothetical protein
MFYEIIKSGRWVAAQIEYDKIDWTSLDAIIDAFHDRLMGWYVEPADALQVASGHFAFPVMALNCILIDTMAQFAKGAGKTNFTTFVSEKIPEFAPAMPLEIRHWDETVRARKKPYETLKTFADALYSAFRCGILHEAHVAAYGMVRGGNLVEQVPTGFTKYQDGTDCPTVIIDPWQLLAKVKGVLSEYIAQLKNRDAANDLLRQMFKTKFTESFGVDISGVA